jgi:hypothetical protein
MGHLLLDVIALFLHCIFTELYFFLLFYYFLEVGRRDFTFRGREEPLTDLQELLVAGLAAQDQDFRPPDSGIWNINRPSSVDTNSPTSAEVLEAVSQLGQPPSSDTERLQLTTPAPPTSLDQPSTFRPSLDVASLVASIRGNQALEEEEEERKKEVRVKESNLQALLSQLGREELKGPPPVQAWDIRTEAKKFREQQLQQQSLKVMV